MAIRRPNVITTLEEETNPPTTPSGYMDRVTIEIYVAAPPYAPTNETLALLEKAYQHTRNRILREM